MGPPGGPIMLLSSKRAKGKLSRRVPKVPGHGVAPFHQRIDCGQSVVEDTEYHLTLGHVNGRRHHFQTVPVVAMVVLEG